jgi:hypothetical protein
MLQSLPITPITTIHSGNHRMGMITGDAKPNLTVTIISVADIPTENMNATITGTEVTMTAESSSAAHIVLLLPITGSP